MRTRAAAAALVLCAALAPGSRAASSALETAALAWDAGDYVAALTTYLQILDSAESDDAFEAIALQTGELFRAREITHDAEAPRFSPDGGHLVYETGAWPDRVTRLLAGDGDPKPVAELRGFRAAFSPDGSRLAYLKITLSRAMLDALDAAASAPPNERAQRTAAFNALVARESRLTIRELAAGTEREIPTGDLQKTGLAFGAAGTLLMTVATDAGNTSQIYTVADGREPVALTSGPGDKPIADVNADGTIALFTVRTGGGGRGRGGASSDASTPTFGIALLGEGRVVTTPGTAPSFSADGKSLTYIRREAGNYQVVVAPAHDPAGGIVVRRGPERADAPALSPDGSRVAYQLMPKDDWEIYLAPRDASEEVRVTREIQHDVLPRFLTNDRLLATIGEPRHRRSHLYDLPSMKRTRLFHNNTVRTIAPEYVWEPSPDGTRLLVVAERDGDTVSPERALYLLDLRERVTRDELRARLRTSLQGEQALRAKAHRLYAPLAAAVRAVTSEASVARVYAYQKALFDFDSKHVTKPGNKLAAAYLFNAYKSFGYQPEYQTFEFRTRNAPPGQTSNVLATLRGTVNPDLVYVVSSHYDSVATGPGADDDTSGTAALLETARIMASRPQPATIVFASFTGEEAGLLGSREFVRQAVANKVRIAGALNNDMIGWANDHRLDNTIRYSNAGIRDIQHAAAMQFSRLITYDALYYKSTDAAAYYEAYGDIVGGIGSYPVLANPHYHQPHDLFETINHQLVTEVAKTTAATLMLLASSPSRLTGLSAARAADGSVTVSWTPSPEQDVQGYLVAFGPGPNPGAQQVRAQKPSMTLRHVAPGTIVSVKAVNARGLEGWDWARVTIE
jgi:Tol biopolymer transport system component